MPLTIFVTAYDEFALRAFEVHAFDYLLKPFGDRFLQALGAVRRAHLAEKQDEQLARRFCLAGGTAPGGTAGNRTHVLRTRAARTRRMRSRRW